MLSSIQTFQLIWEDLLSSVVAISCEHSGLLRDRDDTDSVELENFKLGFQCYLQHPFN